jgi:hypothetical protein
MVPLLLFQLLVIRDAVQPKNLAVLIIEKKREKLDSFAYGMGRKNYDKTIRPAWQGVLFSGLS